MARLLTQGFETQTFHGLTGSVGGYTSVPRISGVAVDAGAPNSAGLTFPLNNITQFYTRFAYSMRDFWTDLGLVTRFRIRDSASNTLLELKFGLHNPITVHLHGAAEPVANIPILMQHGWYVFEIRFNYINGVGAPYNVEIKLDGIRYVQLSQATSLSTENPFVRKLGYIDYCFGARAALDDVAVNDTTGSIDNSWCGDGHVIALTPNANGDFSQFVGSDGDTTANYALVNEIPANTTSYVESSVSAKKDLYHLTPATPSLKPDDKISRVWVSTTARQQSADGSSVNLWRDDLKSKRSLIGVLA